MVIEELERLFLQVFFYWILSLLLVTSWVYISTGATLQFDVELMGINEAPPPSNVFKQIDLDADNQLSKEEVK